MRQKSCFDFFLSFFMMCLAFFLMFTMFTSKNWKGGTTAQAYLEAGRTQALEISVRDPILAQCTP